VVHVRDFEDDSAYLNREGKVTVDPARKAPRIWAHRISRLSTSRLSISRTCHKIVIACLSGEQKLLALHLEPRIPCLRMSIRDTVQMSCTVDCNKNHTASQLSHPEPRMSFGCRNRQALHSRLLVDRFHKHYLLFLRLYPDRSLAG
jgi:hypothetical protein